MEAGNIKYWIFLLIVVLISYGQILGMGVWKDDNAIFFKFDHINEQVGFFGKGLLGVGPYKFSITPYYPIYKVFGNESIVPYYALILVFYFVSTLCVYFLFSKLFSSSLGRIAALLFAAGNISSEGFFWLANSMLAHMAILFISIILIFYNLYFSKKKIFYYLLAVFFFWLSVFLVPLRVHYFIAIVLAFEIIFFAFKKMPKSLFSSFIRSLPFIVIFHHFYISGPDSRALSVGNFIISIFKGELYKTFNFFSSLSNVIIPDNYISFIFAKELLIKRLLELNLPYIEIFSIISLAIFFFILFKRDKRGLFLATVSLILSLLWFFASRSIFSSLLLNISREKIFIGFLGGILLYILILFYFMIEKEKRKLYLFLYVWVLVSIATYAAYQPTAFFGTTHRYFTNTFFSLVGILALLYLFFREKKDLLGRFGSGIIIVWGFLNIVSSFSYQNFLLQTRSIPVANFYKQLKEYLPEIHNGDILYFDVNKDAQDYFRNAFSVSSMPETTAIAWRYKIDRYDFEMYTNYDELISALAKDEKRVGALYTFYYGKNGLIQTTSETRDLLTNGSLETAQGDIGEICSLTPMLLTFKAKVVPDDNKISSLFPNQDQPENDKAEIAERGKLVSYLLDRERYYKDVKVESLSEWRYRELRNVVDKDMDTVWQGHRIWWHDNKHEELRIDLGMIENVNRLIWVNWQHLLSPTSYSIALSRDGYSWETVLEQNSGLLRNNSEIVIENFEPSDARFLSFDITATASDDSPAISEIEVVSSQFSQIDPIAALNWASNPFEFMESPSQLEIIFEMGGPFANIQVTLVTDEGRATYQEPIGNFGIYKNHSVILDPGGTKIKDILFSVPGSPTRLDIKSATVRNLTLSEIKNMGIVKEFSEN